MRKKHTLFAIAMMLATAFAVVFALADNALDAALNVGGGSITFTNALAQPWQVVELDGRTAAKSGNAGIPSSQSTVSASVYVGEGQSLEFDWNVDSEATTYLIMWDCLVFSVNGESIDYIHSVEEDTPLGWQHYTWTADAAGVYTFEWTYLKDASNDGGDDCGYLDNVEVTGEEVLTPTPTPTPEPGESFNIFNESFSESPEDWWNDDFDGDGRFWEWGTAYGHDEPGAIYSYSYADWGGPLTPDNQVCTPEFSIPENVSSASLNFWLYSMDDVHCAEHIDLWVVSISENFYGGYDLEFIAQLDSITLSDGEWHEFNYDMTEYAGYEDINIAFVHCDVTDQYGIVLDDVSIDAVMGGSLIPGDVNGDGSLNIGDALTIMRHGMGLGQLSGAYLEVADFNGDGEVNAVDALLVMRTSMGL